ncbi:MAG TPA: hypothetical protein VIG34_08995 [Xanthobacteraceae bacterium]|jgi:hypothetical protein
MAIMSDPNPVTGDRPLSKPPHTGALPTIGVFVTAPHGIGGMGPLMAALRDQLGPSDRLVVLDGTAAGGTLDAETLQKAGRIEHIRDAGESAFHLRCEIGAMADTDIVVLFEEHAIPGPRFIVTVRNLFAANPSLAAIKVLGRNDTSADPWSWANFFLAFAECVHPANAMPTSMLGTSAAARRSALPAGRFRLGDWETVILPYLNRDPSCLAFSNDVYVDHVDPCGPREALVGNFHNQRALAAVRVAQGHRRNKLAVRAFKDLGLRRHRQIARALAGREESCHVAANRGKLIAIGWAAALGAIVGAYFGVGASMRSMH